MSIFGMAHVIGQICAAPEIDEIEERLHGKEHVEQDERPQQRGITERRISGGHDHEGPGLRPCTAALEARPQHCPDHNSDDHPEADPPEIEELQQNGKIDAAQSDLDKWVGRSKERYEDRCKNERHDPEGDALSGSGEREMSPRCRKIFPDILRKPQRNDKGETEENQGQGGQATRQEPGADERNRHQGAEAKGNARKRRRFQQRRRRQNRKAEQYDR